MSKVNGPSAISSALSFLIWPSLAAVPLVLTSNNRYVDIFPGHLFDVAPTDYWHHPERLWPSPVGLSLGLFAVVVGQVFTLVYFYYKRNASLGNNGLAIQKEGARVYDWWEGISTHLAQPEGFVMLGGYLIFSWMLGLMPATYYSFTGGINWKHVLMQLLIQDFIQFLMHGVEHVIKSLYRVSHKPHHRFTNPRLFDAFNGSPTDTFLMILVPLAITARLVDANVWSYMAFGSIYANWLTLLHSEYPHAWDPLFDAIGFGTPADHHVHHKLFTYNYGHLFM